MSRQLNYVYLVAALLSILLSIWAGAKESVINPDAICYLESAAFMPHGLKAAMHLCPQAKWPFYSMLIYGVTVVTSFSPLVAAYFLNGIFSLVSVLVFITLIRFFTDRPRVWWFAAAVILLSHQFDGVRSYIIRDHGFWAFYLLSLLFLLRYFRTQHVSQAWSWSLSLMIATLFRVEGAVFLLLAPFFAGLSARPLKSFLQLHTLTFLIACGLGIWVLLHPHLPLGRLNEVLFQVQHGIFSLAQKFYLKADALGVYVLGSDSINDAKPILFCMLIGWYILSVISNVSFIYSILIFYAWIKKCLNMPLAVCAYLIINVLITAAFLGENFFFSKRYLIALSLVLMIWVPFALENLWQQWHKRKWPFLLAWLFIILSSLGGIVDFGYSKQYIRDAGDWLASNVPPNARLYANNYQLMYYSEHFGNDIFAKADEYLDVNKLSHGEWKKYQYIAIQTSSHPAPGLAGILQEIHQEPLRVFMNKRGDQVRIYRGGEKE